MKKLENDRLSSIRGGASDKVSATVVNAFTNVIKLLFDAGVNFGSGLRRIGEKNLCPLD